MNTYPDLASYTADVERAREARHGCAERDVCRVPSQAKGRPHASLLALPSEQDRRGALMPRYDDTVRQAVLDDIAAGMPATHAGPKHGVGASTAAHWAKQERKRKGEEWQHALTGGRWVPNSRGVQVWQPFLAPHVRDMNDQERRVEWEDAMFDEEQARTLHARYANGCREDRTVVGERVYQRRKKRAQTAAKRAA